MVRRVSVLVVVCLFVSLPIFGLTYTVINTNDSGAGSLRQGILDANGNAGSDTIAFNIAGGGIHTITPATALPTITDPLLIDGYTQPGSAVNPSALAMNAVVLIELDGVTDAFHGLTFATGGSGSTVRGLAIGNFDFGIQLLTASNVDIEGNYIGTDPLGVAKENDAGVMMLLGSTGNTVGGAAPAQRNLVSANFRGILIDSSDGNSVIGNLIGTNPSGTASLGNTVAGIGINSANGNIIGPGNVISGNTAAGVAVSSGSTLNQIIGNRIGTDINGNAPIPNVIGVHFFYFLVSPSANVVQNNVIRFNQEEGVTFEVPIGVPGDGNRVDDNDILDNGQMSIDLGDDGPTTNDAGDTDIGANSLQNAPAITSAVASPSMNFVAVSGTLSSIASESFRIQIFVDDACGANGFGQGVSIGETTVATDGAGNATFSVTLPTANPPGSVSATAIRVATGDTSEFSPCFIVTAAAAPTLSIADLSVTEGNAGTSNAALTITLSAASQFPVQVSYATSNGTATEPNDYFTANGTDTIAAGQTTLTIFVPIVGDVALEPNETLNVTLSSPVNATISDDTATLTITNDDAAAAVAPIPTVSEIGLALLGIAIALFAFMRLR